MADLVLQIDLSGETYEALQQRAEANGRTMEDEARVILIAALQADDPGPSI